MIGQFKLNTVMTHYACFSITKVDGLNALYIASDAAKEFDEEISIQLDVYDEVDDIFITVTGTSIEDAVLVVNRILTMMGDSGFVVSDIADDIDWVTHDA